MTRDEPLEASIVAWEKKLAAKHPQDFDMGVSACPLCLYHRINHRKYGDRRLCGLCPVAYSGRGRHYFCRGTPYAAALKAYERWEADSMNKALRDKFRKAARAELDFLKSLREP